MSCATSQLCKGLFHTAVGGLGLIKITYQLTIVPNVLSRNYLPMCFFTIQTPHPPPSAVSPKGAIQKSVGGYPTPCAYAALPLSTRRRHTSDMVLSLAVSERTAHLWFPDSVQVDWEVSTALTSRFWHDEIQYPAMPYVACHCRDPTHNSVRGTWLWCVEC